MGNKAATIDNRKTHLLYIIFVFKVRFIDWRDAIASLDPFICNFRLRYFNVNWFKKTLKVMSLSALPVVMGLTSCVADNLINGSEDIPLESEFEPGEKVYMAFNLNFSEDQNSRAAWDSDNSDHVDSGNPEDEDPSLNVFNKGFAGEKAIYADFDPEEETPHFLIFFDENKNRVGGIAPLKLKAEYDDEDNVDYDSQNYLYI